MRKCMKEFVNLLSSRDTCIYVHTYEENEFIKDVADILTGNSEYSLSLNMGNENEEKEDPIKKISADIYVYSRFEGLYTIDKNAPEIYAHRKYIDDVKNVSSLFKFIKDTVYGSSAQKDDFSSILSKATEEDEVEEQKKKISVFILKDLHLFMDKDTIRAIRDIKEEFDEENYCPIIVTAPVVDIPCELEKIFTLFEYELMDKQDIYDFIGVSAQNGGYSEEETNKICEACVGLTRREMIRALSHSSAAKGEIDIKTISDEKVQIVKKSGALDYLTPVQTLENTGGYDCLKTWIREMKVSLAPEAKEFGITQPKGAMLVGLPGNGKTVTAEIIANYLNIPLLKLDLAKIMGSFVGQSERAIANALRVTKACAPCCLLIDEAEKLFGGYRSSGQSDAGTLSRVLAQLLNFLQEDNTGVITIMTSNDVFELPPELMRSGRLDAQWYFGFPNADERREILSIYLKKNNLELTTNLFNFIVGNTKNYSGAEIKEVVKNLLIKSYFRQKQENKVPERIVTVEDVKNAISSIVPIYQSSKEKIDMFTEMAKDRYRNASKEKGAA